MKRSKFTEAQIAFALKQFETGTRVEEVCSKMVISQVELLHFTVGIWLSGLMFLIPDL